MHRARIQWIVSALLLFTPLSNSPYCSEATVAALADTSITVVPRPEHVVVGKGFFRLSHGTVISLQPPSKRMHELAGIFASQFDSLYGFRPTESSSHVRKSIPQIRLKMIPANDSINGEGYRLAVGLRTVDIEAASDRGLFYGTQTLLQLAGMADSGSSESVKIPVVSIRDAPRFPWRGAHLDVGRHFFPATFIKRYIDILAFHKINVFHWHLTDDQGWRIEIKKYPRLTEIGSWRVDRGDLPWELCDPQRPGEKTTYGGFYTQDEIREIVRYAAQRCITIVPEIEMPAHCQAALAAYPEYSCSGGPFTVPTGHIWPDTNIFCAGNDKTFDFVDDVLTEVMTLFPGPYIHVGGDEADKTAWKSCPKCQARLHQEGLTNVEELQSYFIKRVERFLISRGRRLIGWDEILEGGLAPEATVMSWRGMAGGIAAARASHDVIMSPTESCYFDYYQGEQEFEPLAIGGYLPITKVYDFEPVPDSLTALQASHVIGGQANLWTEYVATDAHAEYMLLPRLAALAEVVWSPKEGKDWSDFAQRVTRLFAAYDRFHWHYARSVMRVHATASVDTTARSTSVALFSDIPGRTIRFTLDGSRVSSSSTVYTDPINVDRTMTLRATTLPGIANEESELSRRFTRNIAGLCNVRYTSLVSPHYPGTGKFTLTDMVRGGTSSEDGRWQGFERQDFDVTVDLGAVRPVTRITTGFLLDMPKNILFPDSVMYEWSTDGIRYTALPPVVNSVAQDQLLATTQDFSAVCGPARARFIRVRAKNLGICPAWHHAAGQDAWLFVDEIIIE